MARLDPVRATMFGVRGHDADMTDYSPEGAAGRNALDQKTLAELGTLRPESDADRVAVGVIEERLRVNVDQYAAGEHLRDLRIIGSPFSWIRQVFDLMAKESSADWETIATRMEHVPQGLAGFQAALRQGIDHGLSAVRRQALACAEQGAAWSGERHAAPFFNALVSKVPSTVPSSLRQQLEAGASAATASYAAAARFLREDYGPRAR